MDVKWMKCGDTSQWCSFNRVNLDNDHFNELNGVYIIWSGKQVIRLGSGVIKDRIAAHRNDNEINKFENMIVTWAKVDESQMEGVEKFLADTLNPVVGERFPNRTPITVNLPW